MLKNEAPTEYFEKNEKIKDFYERNKKIIESLLENLKNKIGEGATAEVYFLNSNEEICVKILKSSKGVSIPYHVDLDTEIGFMSDLQNISSDVRVPKPYLSADYRTSEDEDGIRFLIMERIKANSLKDILDGKGELPENFDVESFRNKIYHFLEKMHERNIFHRDLHEGNIMIDNKTGDPYIIDFGASVRGFGEDNPYIEKRSEIQHQINFTDDFDNLDRVCLAISKYMAK